MMKYMSEKLSFQTRPSRGTKASSRATNTQEKAAADGEWDTADQKRLVSARKGAGRRRRNQRVPT